MCCQTSKLNILKNSNTSPHIMAKITIKIRNGKVTTEGQGYKGSACVLPINNLLGILGGEVVNETITPEGALPDEPISSEYQGEVTA